MSERKLLGFRIEVAFLEFAVYVVAESAGKAKAIVRDDVTDPSSVEWRDLRSCRRYPDLDGQSKGIHATYQMQFGEERYMGPFPNRTNIHLDAKEAVYDHRMWF